MTIRRIDPPVPGTSQRLAENGGRLPFKSVDTNGSGRINKEELANAVRLNFPGLTDMEASAIATKAFDVGSKDGKELNAWGWRKAENVVLREAEITLGDKLQAGTLPGAGGAWGSRPVNRPMTEQPPMMPAGYESNMYQPRNDFQTNGQYPYQYPAMPQQQHPVAKAAGRGLLGFLKMIPVVGNVINGIDFVKDIGKGIATWLNPNKTFGEKLKAGSDLLFHGVGMIAPQVGGTYDLAQSAARLAGAAVNAGQQPWNQLPAWQMNQGGFATQYPMQYANQPYDMNQYTMGQFPNYSVHPAYNTPEFAQWNNGGGGIWENWGQNSQYGQQQTDVKGAVQGMARMGVGAVKMMPVVGNVLNGLDFVRDAGRVVKNVLTLHPLKALKAGADLLFHGAGMVVPQVGGAYDLAQGLVRTAAATPNVPSWGQSYYQPNPWSALPAYNIDYAGYPPMYGIP